MRMSFWLKYFKCYILGFLEYKTFDPSTKENVLLHPIVSTGQTSSKETLVNDINPVGIH